ncbi:MAG: AlbA family DNA-binding domain-containing protein [Phycicoccus sp.]
MTFTALHQALGRQPGPIDSEMLDEAIENGVDEAGGLDWKRDLPAEKALAQSDFPKDVAAFANSGGGVLVFGVTEEQCRATDRVDVGEVTESYERTLRRVAVSGIRPPVFGLDVIRVGEEGSRALVVVVPPSVDVPHLVVRGEMFGAPVRNHADTEWAGERLIESMYRQRFDTRRSDDQVLHGLYDELLAGRDTDQRAWLALIAHRRTPLLGRRLDHAQIVGVIRDAETRATAWVSKDGAPHPLEAVDLGNPRRGMRRWVLAHAKDSTCSWYEAAMAVHDAGAVSLVCGIGGHLIGGPEPGTLHGERIRSRHLEAAVSDAMALLRESSRATGIAGEYDVLLGIEWSGTERLVIETTDGRGHRFDHTSIPLARFTPIRSSVRLDADDDDYLAQVAQIALDAVNQGGVQGLQALPMP